MWFDTLILQLRLHMAYRVNGILYRLRFLRLPYENSFAKTLGLVLAVLREIFGMLLGKLLYMAVFFAAPLLLIRRELDGDRPVEDGSCRRSCTATCWCF